LKKFYIFRLETKIFNFFKRGEIILNKIKRMLLVITFIQIILIQLILVVGCGGGGNTTSGILPDNISNTTPVSQNATPLPQNTTPVPQNVTPLPQNTTPASGIELNAIQQAIVNLNAQWNARETSVSSLSDEDKKKICGLIPMNNLKACNYQLMREQIPEVWNWKSSCTAVKNQGGYGTCVSFGIIGALEALLRIKNPSNMPDLSENHLFQLGVNAVHADYIKGWWNEDAAEMIKVYGVPPEEFNPYDLSGNPPSMQTKSGWEQYAVKIKDWYQIYGKDAMKEWLATKGPLVGSMQIYKDFFYYSGGYYQHVYGDFIGSHSFTIIGYDSTGWLCKNSWSENFGETGYFKVKYGECLIDTWPATGLICDSPTQSYYKVQILSKPEQVIVQRGQTTSVLIRVKNMGYVRHSAKFPR
jgi:C1A family cysteine protease